MNDGRLIVKRLDVHTGGQRGANLFDLGVDFVGDIERIAIGLTMHAEQNGGFAVGRNHGVDRSDRGRNLCNIAETNGNACCRALHHYLADLLRRSNLAADQAENQLMIILDETGRVDEVGPADGLENIVDGDAGGEQTRRVGRYLELRNAATLHENGGNTIEPVHAWLDVVGGNFPKPVLRDRV